MNAPFNRHVGLLVLDVTMSNPNGDPDMESEPRTRELDGLGMISPVSLKRKLRDLVSGESEVNSEVKIYSEVFEEAKKKLGLDPDNFRILEERGRDRDVIKAMDKAEFMRAFWDARMFGKPLSGVIKR